MIDSIAFRTRARTVDHLGREQIADCPTAVSELWKNAYDAYARSVALNIYDGTTAIATISDDGHGMNRDEFANRWLVIGTESKADQSETPEADRNGLSLRTKQGQKGIGRLSAANLGPLLLLVSKRADDPFVAALIDWRLFENPYLYLEDIEIPVVEFESRDELMPHLPGLQDLLMSNVWGSREKVRSPRDIRIANAWLQFSKQEVDAGHAETTQSRIEMTVIETVFDFRHFAPWNVWNGEISHGTLLAVSGIQFDLQAQLSRRSEKADSAVSQAQDQLFKTLSNFTDPFLDKKERDDLYGIGEFATTAKVWDGKLHRNLIEEGFPFDLQALNDMEHVVLGKVDDVGVFRGRVKAFGAWQDREVVIRPPIDVSTRKDSKTGTFDLRIGTFEQDQASTSHSPDAFHALEDKAELYAGLLMYRNGLRVLPYGREGSDFFRIEFRRSKHAGREFWAQRRLFGRIALRIEDNPNLRDKAGREGLIDNTAAKTFRDLVEYILRTLALEYFGTDSDLRKRIIPERKEEFKKQKALDARNKQRTQTRKRFKTNLEKNAPNVARLKIDLTQLAERVKSNDLQVESDVLAMRDTLQLSKQRHRESAIGEPPRNLGPLEDEYLAFRKGLRESKDLIDSLAECLDGALEKLNPKSSKDIIYSELSSNAAFLNKRLRTWTQEANSLLESEQVRVAELSAERNKTYHAKMLPLLDDVENEKVTLRFALAQLGAERELQDSENVELFEPYISALQSLKEKIDLAGLAGFSQDQADELREEVDRLHGLAQLGITVEIISHEIEGLDHSIAAGLKEFPEAFRDSIAFADVRDSYEALIERLRFLSPLKLSGQKTRVTLTGVQIFEYVKRFFGTELAQQGIELDASKSFLKFSVYEQPARLLPVFINLVNNAGYWVSHSTQEDKKILLDAAHGRVVVSDTGPGVDPDDISKLFRLFFSRKVRGGRGIGLYLCRANLAAGGHTIEYGTDGQQSTLTGAKFVIDFKGGKYE